MNLSSYSSLWSGFPGVLCVTLIIACCAFNIYSKWVDDSIADRIFYWAMIVTSVGALATHFSHGANPKFVFQSYIVLIVMKLICEICERVVFKLLNGKQTGRRY